MKPDLVVAAKQIDKSDNVNEGTGSKTNDKAPGEALRGTVLTEGNAKAYHEKKDTTRGRSCM